MAEAEKSVRPKSSKGWEHFTLNKRHGMTREQHGNDPAPETQACWSL